MQAAQSDLWSTTHRPNRLRMRHVEPLTRLPCLKAAPLGLVVSFDCEDFYVPQVRFEYVSFPDCETCQTAMWRGLQRARWSVQLHGNCTLGASRDLNTG